MNFTALESKTKLVIQIAIAIGIVLLLELVIPHTWQPFRLMIGDAFGGEFDIVLTELSSWFFGFSVAWFIFQDNPYLNSFMIYSIIPLGVVIGIEFSVYLLFWDYIHLLPFIIDIYIIWKKRNTLKRTYILLFTAILTGFLFLDYFLGLAYSRMSIILFAIESTILALVMIQLSFWVTHKAHPKKRLLRRIFKGFITGLWVFGVFLGSVFMFWYLRPNSANIDASIVSESWVAVTGQHNSNTDLIYWNKTNLMYLIHDKRPFHFGSGDPRLILWSSTDAHNWEYLTNFSVEGNDIRDPKFAIIGDRLFLYALKNVGVIADPYQTIYTYTDDGITWTPFQEIAQPGWLFWRPKTYDNITLYVPAYWHEHGQSILLNSTDGINWNIVATIHVGEANDETAIEFLSDGRMICTGRLEGKADTLFGSSNASTFIAISSYPYTDWTNKIKSRVTRLDGPVLFKYEEKIFAIGRDQVGPRTYFTELGSIFSRKRTSVFVVNQTSGLTYLTDLPSGGDTSYAGVIMNGSELYVSYYTSDITKDYSWILGMISDSDIRMARLNLTALSALAESYS